MIRAEVVTNSDGLFARVESASSAAVAVALSNSGQMLLTRIRANASSGYHKPGLPHIPGSGPGPNVATGDYRRSWRVSTHPDGSVIVSTDAPQGRRLEYGFTGVDSAGRVFNQPPYPHVRPAVEQTRGFMQAQIKAALERELS